MSQDQLLYKMRDTLERINIHYCAMDTLTKSEHNLFTESKNALNDCENLMGSKTIVDGVDVSKLDNWRKHIYAKFERMCADYGYTPSRIRSPNRSSELVDVRQKIAKALAKDGFLKIQIAWAMKRDRSTIYNLIEIRKAA